MAPHAEMTPLPSRTTGKTIHLGVLEAALKSGYGETYRISAIEKAIGLKPRKASFKASLKTMPLAEKCHGLVCPLGCFHPPSTQEQLLKSKSLRNGESPGHTHGR